MLFIHLFIAAFAATAPTHTSNIFTQIHEIRINAPLFREIRRIEVVNENTFALFDVASNAIVLIDSSGSQIATVGRSGAGPGEFRRITDFTLVGDTIYLFDLSNSKISAFHTNGDYINEFRVNKKAFHMTSDGSSLFLYNTMDIHVSEPLIYQLDRQTGSLLSEFGNPSPLLLEMRTGTIGVYRSIAAISTTVCVAHTYEYAINCYGKDGRLAHGISGKGSEFQRPRPEYFFRQSRIQAITHITTGLFSNADNLYFLYRNQDTDVNYMDIYNLQGRLTYGKALIDDLAIRHIDTKTGMAFSTEVFSTASEDYTLLKLYKRVVPR